MGFWVVPLLFIDVPESDFDLVRDDLHVLDGRGMRVYTNENERLTHCAIYFGRLENRAAGGSEWANITEAINGETFASAYYGNADSDRKEKKVETDWIPADTTPATLAADGVSNYVAGFFAVRWIEYRAHAPVVFEWSSDLRFHAMRVGSAVEIRTADWQTTHGEPRIEPSRIVKRTDDGSGVLGFEAQGLNLSSLDSSTGTMVRTRFAFIAPDHVAATYDTATVADRAYCYMSDSSGQLGAGNNPGYYLP